MTRFLSSLAAALVVSAGAAIAQPSQPYRSGIEAVYLDVTVLAADNGIVTGLTKDDFEIYDEGVRHEVAVFSDEPSPISIGVLIDASGSMIGDRTAAALTAARAVGRSLQPKDLWSVYVFNNYLQRIIGWRPYDPIVERELKDLPIRGGTQLFKSVAEMVEQMRAAPHRKRAMLLITDGADDAVLAGLPAKSRIGPAMTGADDGAPMVVDHSDRAIKALRSGEVLVYGLGLDWAPEAGVRSALHVPSLRRLAEPTGGAVATVRTLQDAHGAAQRLADELRSQYTLGFYPKKSPDGKYRRLKVVANDPSYRVRTRAGYLAVKPK